MQGQLSQAVLVDRGTNEIKEARPFVLSGVEGFWDSCLWKLLREADSREKKIWESKICPLFLSYQDFQPFLISAVAWEGTTSTSIFTDLCFRPRKSNFYLISSSEYHTGTSDSTCSKMISPFL